MQVKSVWTTEYADHILVSTRMPCDGRIWWFRLKRGVIYVIYLSGILMRENFAIKQVLKFDQNGFFNPKWQTSCSPETYFACSGMIDTSTECVATRERGDGDYISGTAQALFSWKRQIKNIILSQSCKTFLSFLLNFLSVGETGDRGYIFVSLFGPPLLWNSSLKCLLQPQKNLSLHLHLQSKPFFFMCPVTVDVFPQYCLSVKLQINVFFPPLIFQVHRFWECWGSRKRETK